MKRIAALLAIAVSAAACSGGSVDRITYTDPENRALVEIPSDWNIYEPSELTGLEEMPFVEDVQGLSFPPVHTVAFDGAPAENVENLVVELSEATYPVGAATVRAVGSSERDFISRFVLTQSVIPYRSFASPRELTKEDFSFGDGYEGVRVLVAFADETGAQVGVAYLISVTDPTDEHLYSVVVGCSVDCFTQHQDEIEGVVDSWLVNTKA